jgi:hypothetical protein
VYETVLMGKRASFGWTAYSAYPPIERPDNVLGVVPDCAVIGDATSTGS